ncbi:DUF4184 family protein [Microbacterium imperiale]|uniref:Cell wall anchor protein n=1 Tax=Microbacterium imperiale TaxID=33884 RepID=A0A9W6M251_9MICO|nr:DUF4184 family protein [Microbacterium imperiale]MBP2420038.1 hypothetical protein [Microbacterium imperiale]MDS0198099.1 DUF4184 family protein [Microbacterium imperiale]BFE40379.1 hypothetical protein GCM10017544_13350 [Microbacterium imperiale]GLJ78645.1 hypothetical protein GCM10017586_03270 [Microbacterium imperiale]
MPFTPSHAVVALAVVRTPLVPAAVAVGAMAPDLPLFVRGIGISYAQTHAYPWLTVAIAGVLLLAWWLLLRPAVRELAPGWVAGRLPSAWDATGGDALRTVQRISGRRRSVALTVALVVVSLVIGVLSHIAWDAFTHEGRWGVELIPALAERWGPLHGYRWFQYASSTLGLLGLAVAGAVWLRGRARGPVRRVLPGLVRVVWWASLPFALVVATVFGLVAYGPLTAEWTAQHLAYRVLPPACALWGVATLVLCVIVQVARRRATR